MDKAQPPPTPASVGEVRNFFPPTWLWNLVEIGDDAYTTILLTVPDTITQFNAMTFCLGNSGFGLSSEASLTVFKPFFVDLVLPYSIIQGETLPLKALVFNYLTQCLKVQVTLLSSSNFTVQDCNSCVYTECICGDDSVDFTWNITANIIGYLQLTVSAKAIGSIDTCGGKPVYVPPSGNVDTVQKQLLVKPQGIKVELTQNMFVCLKGSVEERNFTLELPSVFVSNSESAYISVMGDILGTALQNLDSLIAMPYGCGEQNMLTMAPIIYVLDYLSATAQLGSALKDQALYYLQNGYQRELNYKHLDGSFSAFGDSDGVGSTWLTAFVTKSFYQAEYYIFIDDQVLNQAVTWLGNNQRADGCFTIVGKLFHTLMKGGVNDDLSLSAYTTAALLEHGGSMNNQHIKLDLALACLQANVSITINPYTWALMAYAFTLSNDTVTRQVLLDKLYTVAQSSGSDLYWPYTFSSSSGDSLVSASVEMTAYVLLALVSGPTIQPNELTDAARIVNWLSKQQNPYGGFASTQDTVVGIQALAKYAKATYNPEGDVLVTVFAN
ncbi:alpha-2-macroglobulin-like protein 1, partial [Mantella aurantiaca]